MAKRYALRGMRCGGRGRALAALLMLACAAIGETAAPAALELSGQSREQNALVDGIRAALAAEIERGVRDGSALQIDYAALYAPLTPPQRSFLDALRALEPEIPSATPPDAVQWVRLEGQVVRSAEREVVLPVQLLPEVVAEGVEALNLAMRAEIGREIAVGSGYHSAANHTHLFVSLLPVYGYSIRETARHVSLPGRSEHSRPECQGIDFINREGADLSYSKPAEVAELPEFRWLRANAARFGFALSHPIDTPEHAFSPWHWHWQASASSASSRSANRARAE